MSWLKLRWVTRWHRGKDLTPRYLPSSQNGWCLRCHERPIGWDPAERYCDQCFPQLEQRQLRQLLMNPAQGRRRDT